VVRGGDPQGSPLPFRFVIEECNALQGRHAFACVVALRGPEIIILLEPRAAE
jgi:hypothetical protein